jgi:hypothetical protein
MFPLCRNKPQKCWKPYTFIYVFILVFGTSAKFAEAGVCKSLLLRLHLPTELSKALDHYQLLGHLSANLYLRNPHNDPKTEKYIHLLDRVISHFGTVDSGIYYRGEPYLSDQQYNRQPGEVFIEPGFLSTTSSRKVGLRFVRGYDKAPRKGVLYKIHVPKGIKGAPMSGITGIYEMEYLLNRGLKFRVIKTEKLDDLVVLQEIEIVPKE